MIVVMEPGASPEKIERVVQRLKELGFDTHLSEGVERTIIGAIGQRTEEKVYQIESIEGVERTLPITQPFKLSGKEFKAERTQVRVGDVVFGGELVPVIAGPCAVESEEQIIETARAVKEHGAHLLRGGAYKPRTSPYSFQGLEEDGLKMLAAARAETGLPVVTEVVDPRDVELVCEYADLLQVGARNMQNFALLKELGQCRHPVMLKRGLAATISEWLQAADYIISGGNRNVILCERGIRTYETETRNTLDLSAVPAVRELSHLPIVVDPSHGTGKWRYVTAMARAGVAAGADGIIVEVHPRPEEAVSDGPQSLRPEIFGEMMRELRAVASAVGRRI